MKTAETFLRNFFAVRGLSGPIQASGQPVSESEDGQPAYRYRLREGEFVELREVLTRELGGPTRAPDSFSDWATRRPGQRPIGPKAAMAFCLWASEWWRINYEAGPWKWEPLLATLEASEFAPGGWRYPELQRLVLRGLRGWRRSVHIIGGRRRFLVTLVCEGGLPLKLILRENTHLRTYLRSVLDEFRLFFGSTNTSARDLAERPRTLLPRSWRQEAVYQLAGELIQEIWRLQAKLDDTTTTPVQDLDRKRPGWRDELPVRVSDEVARALLNGLLQDAVEVARRTRVNIRWKVGLAQVANGEWELRGSFDLPSTITTQAFADLFSLGSQIPPRRFDLAVRTDKERFRPLALGAERHTGDARYLSLEKVVGARRFQTTDLTGSRKLLARAHDKEYATDLFPGASGLGDLPWVFSPAEPGDLGHAGRLVGQGSVRLAEQEALVAVNDGVSVETGGGEAAIAGNVRNGSRRVYRVSGTVVFTDGDGSKTIVKTNSKRTHNVEYHLVGTERNFGGTASIYLGGPVLHERREGEFWGRIPERHLQWKSAAPAGSWMPYSCSAVNDGTIRGWGRLRYIKDDKTRHAISIGILPKGADIEILPSGDARQGEVRLTGLGRIEAAVPPTPGIEAGGHKLSDGYRLVLNAAGDAPREVEIVIDWSGRDRLRLTLPFPAKRAMFVALDGRPLPVGARLAQGFLVGAKAEVLVPHDTRYRLRGFSVPPRPGDVLGPDIFVRKIPVASFGHHIMDLAEIHSEIAERLELSVHPHAAVNLRIVDAKFGRPFPSADVSVGRFDLAFVRHGDVANPGVTLTPESLDQLGPGDLDVLEVEMLSLLDPDQEPTRLRQSDTAVWRVPQDLTRLEPGPHLVLGRQGDLQRVRPMPWHVGEPERSGAADPANAATVAEAYARAPVEDHAFSDEPFRPVVGQMVGDPGHPDWPLVFAYLRRESLPVRSFALLRALVRDPVACAMATAHASAGDFELLWERMVRFPFAWWQIPRASWDKAYMTCAECWQEMLDPEDDKQAWDILARYVDDSIDRVKTRLPGLSEAFEVIKVRAAGRPIPPGTFPTPEELGKFHKDFYQHRRACPAPSPRIPPNGIPELRSEVGRFVRDHPWARSIFPRIGMFEERRRADFADAPALTAGMVMAEEDMPSDNLTRVIRAFRAYHPDWFDEALRLALRIAFKGYYR